MKPAGILLLLLPALLPSWEWDDLSYHLEFDQMLQLRAGVTWSPDAIWAMRASIGLSPLDPATISYNIMGILHLSREEAPWQFDLEFGLPLGYVNLLEGAYIDQDPIIDDPFAGWLPGLSLRVGRLFDSGLWALRLGAASCWEWQRDSGCKGPALMPILSLAYEFS